METRVISTRRNPLAKLTCDILGGQEVPNPPNPDIPPEDWYNATWVF